LNPLENEREKNMSQSSSLPPTFQEKDLNFYLRMIRSDYSTVEEMQPQKLPSSQQVKNIVIVLTSDGLGRGRQNLGKRLMLHFLQALININIKPKAIILLNSAVQMSFGQNETIGKLTMLEEQGSKIMVCVSSLQDYEYKDKLSVGFEASMDEICEMMMTALKVVTL
jgi:intracellular sulfur oxidation DsrE/DsrF family protein